MPASRYKIGRSFLSFSYCTHKFCFVFDDSVPIFVQEAKNAFKALLEFANVEADWIWEQVMYQI